MHERVAHQTRHNAGIGPILLRGAFAHGTAAGDKQAHPPTHNPQALVPWLQCCNPACMPPRDAPLPVAQLHPPPRAPPCAFPCRALCPSCPLYLLPSCPRPVPPPSARRARFPRCPPTWSSSTARPTASTAACRAVPLTCCDYWVSVARVSHVLRHLSSRFRVCFLGRGKHAGRD